MTDVPPDLRRRINLERIRIADINDGLTTLSFIRDRELRESLAKSFSERRERRMRALERLSDEEIALHAEVCRDR